MRAKINDLFAQGRLFEARFYTTLSPWFQRGIEQEFAAVAFARQDDGGGGGGGGGGDSGGKVGGGGGHAEALLVALGAGAASATRTATLCGVKEEGKESVGGHEADSSAVAALKERLRWRGEEEEEQWGKDTGSSLIFWAAAGNDLDALQALLYSRGHTRGGTSPSPSASTAVRRDLRRALKRAWPSLALAAKQTPLHVAMWIASKEVVRSLLDAGADPTCRLGAGDVSPLFSAASMLGQEGNAQEWLERFPRWNLEQVGVIGVVVCEKGGTEEGGK